jgi:ABC-type nitrate/sulfonate/bicarbonate transport system permease component
VDVREQRPSLNKWHVVGVAAVPLVMGTLLLVAGVLAPATIETPSMVELVRSLIHEASEGQLVSAIQNTLTRVVASTSLATAIGMLVGFLFARNEGTWAMAEPTIDFARSIPMTFVAVVLALIVGSTAASVLIVGATVPCALIVTLNVRAGIKSQVPERMRAFELLRGRRSRAYAFWRVTVPEILPHLVTALRLALSYAVVVITVLEYMKMGPQGEAPGVGSLVADAFNSSDPARLYALTASIGAIGLILNKGLTLVESRIWRWTGTVSP